jgi:hypothetical protein
MSKFDFGEAAGDRPGPQWIGDRQLSWRECLEAERERNLKLSVWAGMWSDLDRSQHGRHEGDAEGQDPTGISQGNPFIAEGDWFGFDIAGRPYRMPPRGQRGKPEAWLGEVSCA